MEEYTNGRTSTTSKDVGQNEVRGANHPAHALIPSIESRQSTGPPKRFQLDGENPK